MIKIVTISVILSHILNFLGLPKQPTPMSILMPFAVAVVLAGVECICCAVCCSHCDAKVHAFIISHRML